MLKMVPSKSVDPERLGCDRPGIVDPEAAQCPVRVGARAGMRDLDSESWRQGWGRRCALSLTSDGGSSLIGNGGRSMTSDDGLSLISNGGRGLSRTSDGGLSLMANPHSLPLWRARAQPPARAPTEPGPGPRPDRLGQSLAYRIRVALGLPTRRASSLAHVPLALKLPARPTAHVPRGLTSSSDSVVQADRLESPGPAGSQSQVLSWAP